MNNRTNLAFFNSYLELDKACADRFGIKQNGVSTYINRLVDLRFAPGRNEVLAKLIKYRNCRNTIAHEVNAINSMSELTKADIKWIISFTKSINYKTDPVSRYERKAVRYSVWRKVRTVLIGILVVAIGVAVYAILKHLQIL